MIDVAGMPTRARSAHFSARGPACADATCVRQLRRAGAVIVGKTTTHEFAYGPTGDRSADGPSRNPRDLTRISGGSSGGSAAAVAAGLIPLALGTDTGGSVRIPAALCGASGFKPAYGAIDTQGVFPLAQSLDHVGVIARTARDGCAVACALSAASQAAGGPRQPEGASDPPDRFGSGARVAWLNPPTTVDAEVAGTARAALERKKVPISLAGVWNLLGFPAFSVPADTVGGLPVGLQLVSAPGKEALAVELAARLEE